jgi:hypothetical protein
MGAEQVPNAAIELRRADDQIAYAQTLSKKGDNDAADIVAQRASADADLAAAYVNESEAIKRAHAARGQAGMAPAEQTEPENPGPVYLNP